VELNRRILFTGLVLAIILSDSIIFLATDKSRDFYSNWIININSAIAAALAIFIVFRQKFHTLHGKAHAALAIGLSLWLCAEIIWAMYEIVWQIVAPVPSVADYLWLSAYGFLAYYLFATYKEFNKKFRFSKKVLIASITGSVIFVTYIIGVTTSLSVLSRSHIGARSTWTWRSKGKKNIKDRNGSGQITPFSFFTLKALAKYNPSNVLSHIRYYSQL